MVLSALINGLTLSALLFIMAIGLNLSFGLLRVVNLSGGPGGRLADPDLYPSNTDRRRYGKF